MHRHIRIKSPHRGSILFRVVVGADPYKGKRILRLHFIPLRMTRLFDGAAKASPAGEVPSAHTGRRGLWKHRMTVNPSVICSYLANASSPTISFDGAVADKALALPLGELSRDQRD